MLLCLRSSHRNSLGFARFGLAVVLPLGVAAVLTTPAFAQQKTNPGPASLRKVLKKQGAVRPLAPRTEFTSVKRLKTHLNRLEDEAERKEDEEKREKDTSKENEIKTKRRVATGEPAGERESVPDYLEALLYYTFERAYPNDSIDSGAFARAAEARSRMPIADWNTKASGTNNGVIRTQAVTVRPNPITVTIPVRATRWEFVGPRNLPTPYVTYYGPADSTTSGRVNGLAFAPTNDSIAYLAAAGGGVWKTLNGGKDWFAVGDTFNFLYTSSVVVDPQNANTVYVGVGDFDGQNGFGYTGGVMKSTDGGATWTRLGTSVFTANSAIPALVVDPDDSQTVVTVTGRGPYLDYIYRSTNGGTTWSSVPASSFSGASGFEGYAWWSDLRAGVKDTVTGTRYYYAVANRASNDASFTGIYRSSDKGTTWTKISIPSTVNNNSSVLARVVPSKANYNVVYYINGYDNSIYKGTLTGGPTSTTYTWTNLATNYPNGSENGQSANYNWSQDFYDLYLNVAGVPAAGTGVINDVLYGSNITFAGSANGGTTWTDIGVTYTGGAKTHNDQHVSTVSPLDPAKLLVGNDGGVYGLTYDKTKTGSAAWTIDTSLNLTLGLTQIYHADWHPTDSSKMIGGAQDNATPVSLGLGTNGLPIWDNVGGGDGGGSSINPIYPNYQYTTSQNAGVYATNDGWNQNYRYIAPTITGDNRPFVTTTAVDPNGLLRFYIGTNYLYRYSESSLTWENRLGSQALAGANNSGATISAIAIASGDSNTIYTGSTDGLLYVTMNGGTSWTQLSNGSGTLPNRTIKSIAINPNNKNDVLISLSGTGTGHLWRGTVSGTSATFTNLSGSDATGLPDFPLNEVARDPNSPASIFYAATDGGVFVTTNGGASWANATAPLGLPNVQCNAIKAVAGTGYVNVATYGRGFWRIPLLSAQNSAPAPNLTTTYTITRSGSNFVVVLSVRNNGGPAANVQLNTVKLTSGATGVTPTETLPSVLGSIATGGYINKTLTFPVSSLAAGSTGVLSFTGVYSTGTWSSSVRVTLP